MAKATLSDRAFLYEQAQRLSAGSIALNLSADMLSEKGLVDRVFPHRTIATAMVVEAEACRKWADSITGDD